MAANGPAVPVVPTLGGMIVVTACYGQIIPSLAILILRHTSIYKFLYLGM